LEPLPRRPQKGSKKPEIAAALMIISFLLAVITAAGLLFLDIDTLNLEDSLGDEVDDETFDMIYDYLDTYLRFCGVIFLIIGIVQLVGAYFAIKRTYWIFVVIAAFLGLFTIGPFCLGSILSIAAVVFIFLSKDEFDQDKGTPPEQYPPQQDSYYSQPPTPPQSDSYNGQPPPPQSKLCDECGEMMTYDEGYGLWFCERCDRYK